jgi:predicted nucleic acid-binding protein
MGEGPILCDAGPLIALSLIRQLDLITRLYGHVLIPEAVLLEVVESGAGRAGAIEVHSAPWIQCIRLNAPPDPLLAEELGPGEAEVIAAGYQLNARLVLIDERRARRIAEQAYKLRVKGSAGVLVSAKRAGLISKVRPLLLSMCHKGYFLSERLIERACAEADE